MSNDNPFNFDDERTQTNTQLATQLQKLQALTAGNVQALFPDMGDRAAIERLIAAVNAAADRNRKIAVLQQNLAAGGALLANLVSRIP